MVAGAERRGPTPELVGVGAACGRGAGARPLRPAGRGLGLVRRDGLGELRLERVPVGMVGQSVLERHQPDSQLLDGGGGPLGGHLGPPVTVTLGGERGLGGIDGGAPLPEVGGGGEGHRLQDLVPAHRARVADGQALGEEMGGKVLASLLVALLGLGQRSHGALLGGG